MADGAEFPTPIRDADSEPFWEGVDCGELRLQRCLRCERFRYFPRVLCPYCHSDQAAWERLSGRGVIYSYTVSRRPARPVFADRVPYVVALIDLAEGPRMMSNIVDAKPEEVRIGASVLLSCREVSDGCTLPLFVLA